MPLLVGEKMKMGFVTNHLPFRDIAGNITVNNIYYKLKLLDACLKKDFTIRKPCWDSIPIPARTVCMGKKRRM